MKRLLLATAAAALLGLVTTENASAGERRASDGSVVTEHPKARYYRKRSGTRVYGYTARRGGYSYSYEDTLNTYGSSRTRYGGSLQWRDPQLDRQTTAGPFDHGFFFDSGIAPRGGDSPYMN